MSKFTSVKSDVEVHLDLEIEVAVRVFLDFIFIIYVLDVEYEALWNYSWALEVA